MMKKCSISDVGENPQMGKTYVMRRNGLKTHSQVKGFGATTINKANLKNTAESRLTFRSCCCMSVKSDIFNVALYCLDYC